MKYLRMNVRRRTRQLTATLGSLMVLLFAAGLIQAIAPADTIATSSEVGYVSFSPRGPIGGTIVPASKESSLCPVPSLTFTADSGSTPVVAGNSTILRWDTTGGNPQWCEAFGDWQGYKISTGSESTGPLTEKKTYTLMCISQMDYGNESCFNTASKTVKVEVTPRNACYPSADPANYGTACASVPNVCGQTQSNGTIQCDSTCSSTPPSDASCPATGTLDLTPQNCVIAKNESTCTVKASWSTERAVGAFLWDRNVSEIKHTANNFSYPPGFMVWVAYPQTMFDLKNGDETILDSKPAGASCAEETAWSESSGKCVSSIVWGKISANPNPCTIAVGGNTCSTNLDWEISAQTPNPNVYSSYTGGTLSTAYTGTGVPATVGYPETTFEVRNAGAMLNSVIVGAQCTSGSAWDGVSCVAPPVATIIQSTSSTAPGETFQVSWGSTYAAYCEVAYSVDGDPWVSWASGLSGTQNSTPPSPGTIVFRNTCTNSMGSHFAKVTHTVTAGSPSVNGSCATTHYNCSSGTLGSWSDADPNFYKWSCVGSGGGTPDNSCSEAKSGGGSCSSSPAGTITASPSRVRVNGTTHLAWNVTNVDISCTVSGPGVSVTTSDISCAVTGPGADPTITQQSRYTLTCDGTFVDDVIVNILPVFEEF